MNADEGLESEDHFKSTKLKSACSHAFNDRPGHPSITIYFAAPSPRTDRDVGLLRRDAETMTKGETETERGWFEVVEVVNHIEYCPRV